MNGHPAPGDTEGEGPMCSRRVWEAGEMAYADSLFWFMSELGSAFLFI